MSSLSIAAGKHAVVGQDGKLATPFVAFYSLFNPRAVARVMADSGEATAMAALADLVDSSDVGLLPIEEAAKYLAEAGGFAWDEVIAAGDAVTGGSDFTFAKAIAANLKDAKSAMSQAAVQRAQNQAMRSAIQGASAALAADSWQLVHCCNAWADIASHGPLSPTTNFPTTPVVIEASTEELSGLFTTRFDTLSAAPSPPGPAPCRQSCQASTVPSSCRYGRGDRRCHPVLARRDDIWNGLCLKSRPTFTGVRRCDGGQSHVAAEHKPEAPRRDPDRLLQVARRGTGDYSNFCAIPGGVRFWSPAVPRLRQDGSDDGGYIGTGRHCRGFTEEGPGCKAGHHSRAGRGHLGRISAAGGRGEARREATDVGGERRGPAVTLPFDWCGKHDGQ